MEEAKLASYISDLFATEDEPLKFARDNSSRQGLPRISIEAYEGRFLQLLVRACNAKKALEIGTLGGYSGIWIARGLRPDGLLITLEKENRHAQVAHSHFKRAGLENMVEIRVGDAHTQLAAFSNGAQFDFVFIDAEKSGYSDYFAWAVEHVRIGGIITAHNVLAYGRLLDENDGSENIERIRHFNQTAADDKRLISTIFPIGDGILASVKVF
jgi:caffeoyl-CoA O-methyltransferase